MKNPVVIIVGVVIVLGGLLVWSSSFQTESQARLVEGTNVECLPNGHQQLALHVHPRLTIFVDGEREFIPANVGIIGSCMSEMHTHDNSGTLHVETASHDRFNQLSLRDFFDVWGEPFEREGYSVAISVNGEEVEDIDAVQIEDHAAIEISYTSEATQ